MEQDTREPRARTLLTVYVAAVGVMGFLALVASAAQRSARSPWLVLLLIGLAALAGARPVRFPRQKTELTVTHPFIFLAYAACGTFAAAAVATAGLAAVLGAQARRGRWLRLAFNAGSVVLATVPTMLGLMSEPPIAVATSATDNTSPVWTTTTLALDLVASGVPAGYYSITIGGTTFTRVLRVY